MSKRSVWLTVGTVLLLALMMVIPALAEAPEPPDGSVPLNGAHKGAKNSEFTPVGTCPTPPEGQEGWWGWHFILPGNNNFEALSVTFQTAGTFMANPFPDTIFKAHPDNSHAYIWTETDDTLLSGWAISDGANNFFNLSHVCPGDPDVEP